MRITPVARPSTVDGPFNQSQVERRDVDEPPLTNDLSGSEVDRSPCGAGAHPGDVGTPSGVGTLPNKDIGRRFFVAWPDNELGILFTDTRRLKRVDAQGTQLRSLVDTKINDDLWGRIGIFADYSSAAQRVVYTSCEVEGRHPDSGAWQYGYEIATVSLDGSDRRRLTNNRSLDNFPAWSPDGSRIAYLSGSARLREYSKVVIVNPMSHRDGQVIIDVSSMLGRPLGNYPPVWSPDGSRLALLVEEDPAARRLAGNVRWGLYSVKSDGSDWRRVSGTIGGASWSPDGQQLAFPNRDGLDAVLVVSDSDGSSARVVTKITAWSTFVERHGKYDYWSFPHPISWSPDGAHLMYVCDAGVCVVDRTGRHVGTSPGEFVEERRRTDTEQPRPSAAWSPDGSRIVVRIPESRPVHGSALLYTMAPDGSQVDVPVRAGVGLTAANSGFKDIAQSRSACTEGFVVVAATRNPGLVRDCETLLGVRDSLFGESVVTNWHFFEVFGSLPGTHPNLDRGVSTNGYVVSNWGPGTPIHEWAGVTVSGTPPRVTALRLSGYGFSGTLPAALGELAELEVLDLSRNRLAGPLPAQLAKLTKLQILNVSSNELSGQIPVVLSELPRLNHLHLKRNQLSGCIPAELRPSGAHDLQDLDLPRCEAAA